MSVSGGYTPLFESLTRGSLCGKWPDIGLWAMVLSMANWQGEIQSSHRHIAQVSGLDLDEVIACMDRFCAPDEHSGSRNDDGRRLEVLSDAHGWRVINIQKYRDKASDAKQVMDGRNAAKVRKYKERHRRTPADTGGHLPNVEKGPQTPRTLTADCRLHTSDSDSEKSMTAAPRALQSVRRETLPPIDPDWVLDFKLAYPPRAGDNRWRSAMKAARARFAEGHTTQEFIAGAKRYAAFCLATGDAGTQFVKSAATFLGPDKGFLEPWTPPATKSQAQQDKNISAAQQWLANRAEVSDASR